MKQSLLIIISLTLLVSLAIFGQGKSVDAYKSKLQLAKGEERIPVLVQLGRLLLESQPKKAEDYLEEALELSRDFKSDAGILQASYLLGQYEKANGSKKKATRYVKQGVAAASRLQNKEEELVGWAMLIELYELRKKKGDLEEAKHRYEELTNELALREKSNQLENLKQEIHTTKRSLAKAKTENQVITEEKDQIEDLLELTVEEKLRKEAALAKTAQEVAELELKALDLKMQTFRKELEISQKENEILLYDSKLRKQQFWGIILGIGMLATIVITFLVIRNYRLQKERAEEKGKLQHQLMMQEKMATLGRLTAGIAHEIKNPLNFVNNFAEGSAYLVEELEETIEKHKADLKGKEFESILELVDEVKQNSADILHHGKRADRIVNAMMEHTRNEKGTIHLMDINQLIEDNLNLAYHGYRAQASGFNADLQRNLERSIPAIQMIPKDLNRVFLNIFNNAFYAVHQKQKKLGATYHPKLTVNTTMEGEWVVVKIRDNGPGIPSEVREAIFDPFFTTKPTGSGNAGLGLSISYDIVVHGHRGKLEVESQKDTFTEFIISLPTNLAVSQN